MNFPATLGFNLGVQCFSSLFSNCFNNYSYQNNPFTYSNSFTPMNFFSPVGFDTFTYSSGNMFNNFGVGLNNFTPVSNWNFTSGWNFMPNWNNSSSVKSTKASKTSNTSKPYQNGKAGNGTHIYEGLSKKEALERAKQDPNLEELTSGTGWRIEEGQFMNDIPFARKGTAKLLDKVCKEQGVTILITSALGTKTSPHIKGNGGKSHYNEKNPKLDFGGYITKEQAEDLAAKLKASGLFCWILIEKNEGNPYYHLDVQFSDDAYKNI